MASKLRVGIMGGTFNPIHNGHILLAKRAYAQYNLDKILFMPAFVPPHKSADIEDSSHRENMVKLAIKDTDYFEFSDIESKREGKSYTYKTLEILTKENPDTEFFFIMGADSLFQFDTWKNPQLIVKYATVIAAKRNSIPDEVFENRILELNKQYKCEIQSIQMEDMPISSTTLRIMHGNGEDISKHINADVYRYINENNLYSEYSTPFTGFDDFDSLREDLKERLTPHRYEHTICVANICSALAMKYEYDVFKANLAGMLHDIAKCMPDEELLKICKQNCIRVTDIERSNPYLLHGKVGAYIAKKNYRIIDEDILNSITYHTTGRPDMSMLEKIVFVADYIEPMRDVAPNLKYIRKIAFEDIDKAICLIINNTLSYLNKKGSSIDKTTVQTYEYYKCL